MQDRTRVRAEAERLTALFEETGAVPFRTSILQPAETLLDLYGEDIRARAYVTRDPSAGEMMLRPDFTAPLVQAHLAGRGGITRYTYVGEVFRMQDGGGSGRPIEYLQVGLELFPTDDPAAAEAEVFATISRALQGLNLRAAMGDIGLLQAAVSGLSTSPARRAALLRHLWRPRRFRALLERFSGRTDTLEHRVKLLKKLETASVSDVMAEAAPMIGIRSGAEIENRITALKQDAQTPPISPEEVALIDDLLAIQAAPADALERLRDLAVDMPAIEPAVACVSARFAALDALDIDVSAALFEGSYGRTSLEYYDGFVFGFYAENRPDLSPVATGGRYDALTRALGQEVAAVGGVIRPALVLEVQG
ncbi:ATP phosphoribosyltransferase regulatory subunit [Actibacterium sp. 188UL27-1]|uniref:ATP phosphoribosyltransferase regulatory subunit n=1 Tax=Actibacterium sp. 188UL27-1 TaxID=2786961 RepID=UPI00195D0111|nr:ATP phosphoribosyltransferase regulatory subunit [Actibacterium sp. 188UL27-1]MBM7067375.1 ATP phosphoribosyltransferase regulatory subunit [Actibacterium sp. 188UL27-1]